MFGDDAVGISWVKAAAKDGLKEKGLLWEWWCAAVLHQEPAEGAQDGGDAVGLVAGGVPDLTEDSEMGWEVQDQSGRGTLKGDYLGMLPPLVAQWRPIGGRARYGKVPRGKGKW